MKEVKVKDKNRRSCCERYIKDYMQHRISFEYIIEKMKINPQLSPLVEKKLNDVREKLLNIPLEMWGEAYESDVFNMCVNYILNLNTSHSHIAKYMNAVHKGRINITKMLSRTEYLGAPVVFAYDEVVFTADFVAECVKVESVGKEIKNLIIY